MKTKRKDLQERSKISKPKNINELNKQIKSLHNQKTLPEFPVV